MGVWKESHVDSVHMGTPTTDRRTGLKYYLPTTWLVGGNNSCGIMCDGMCDDTDLIHWLYSNATTDHVANGEKINSEKQGQQMKEVCATEICTKGLDA